VVARRRRQNKDETQALPVIRGGGISVYDLAQRHLLLVPTTVGVDVVSDLLKDRIRDVDLVERGEAQFGRHSRLSGPYELTIEDAVDAAVPMPWTVCYCLEAPIEREGPPTTGLDDRDGFAYAFPEGLPWREEGRALHLLVALARRIGGAVRVAGTMQLIMPDPDRAVDHIVHTPTWLEPDVLLGVVRRTLPGAQLAVEAPPWHGPSDEAYDGTAVQDATAHAPLSPEQIDALHLQVDALDIEAMAEPMTIDGFAITADVGWDGSIEVLVHMSDGDEPAVEREPWSHQDFFTYEVRWVNSDPVEREQRYPSGPFLSSRSRVVPLVTAVTATIVEATGGLVVDEDGFAVDRYRL
jgi:hypothetical protein